MRFAFMEGAKKIDAEGKFCTGSFNSYLYWFSRVIEKKFI